MQSALIVVASLASALAGPQGYSYAPPKETYIPPPKNTYIPPPKETYIPPPQPSRSDSRLISSVDSGRYLVPEGDNSVQTEQPNEVQQPVFEPERVLSQPSQLRPQKIYQGQRQKVTPQYVAPLPAVSTQPPPVREVLPDGDSAELPLRFTRFDYSPNTIVNRNPGSGNSGPMGVFVGACAASMVCVPEAMCNPYTGFVRGGLLFEPTGPSSQPTVALLRCYRLKDGGFGDGVCCQMPHINDPWPDFQ